jgi:2-polyprenyl-6-methoxyphenol hydroxylase-like FAD-dependent oxidoreductase
MGHATDVLVVGGGPAGLAATIAARKKGFCVMVRNCFIDGFGGMERLRKTRAKANQAQIASSNWRPTSMTCP